MVSCAMIPLHLPLVASCVVLGGLPIRAAAADASRTATVPLSSYLFRLEPSIEPLPTMGAPPKQGAASVANAAFAALRMDQDYPQQRVAPDGAKSARRDDPISDAVAEATRSVKVVLGDSLIYDSNLLRLPNGVDPLAATGVSSKSDAINVAYVGLSVDKTYAQQRIELDVTETAYRYAHLAFLNFNALDYRGAWHWRLTPRWGGTLQSERRVALASFADSQFSQRNQRNLRVTDSYRLSLDGSLFGGWHALFGAFQNQTKYDQGFLPQNSSRTQGVEAGIKYERASGSALSLVQRAIQGEYLNRVADAANFSDNAFRQSDVELKLDWNLSGKSAIRGRLTWVAVRHEHFSARDFSGLAGELSYGWTPMGKLRVDVAVKRDIAPWWQDFSSYKIDDSLSIMPTWQVGAKTSVRARLEHIQSDFLGPVRPPVGPLRKDTGQTMQLGVDWRPLRNLVLDASLQHQRRTSNSSGVDFDTRSVALNAKLKF
jgi:exopolysaccharide biosynthesis operon protein EpsL